MTEARLEDVGSGLAPVTPGWFVVNAEQAAWVDNDAFGARCVFEASTRVLAERPDVEPQWFPQLGITLTVIQPGKPSGLYHSESAQEDFLVLAGECVALIEGEERPLRRWDFVHCPPGTVHSFVGAGAGPCVLLMVGCATRGEDALLPALGARAPAPLRRRRGDGLAAGRLCAVPRLAARQAGMGDRGFEPRTSALSERRSNQLS